MIKYFAIKRPTFKYSALLFLAFGALSLSSQVTNVSPYSRYGLGELYPAEFNRHLGMGGASLGLPDKLNLNFSNPASFTQLQLTTFEAGLEMSFLRQSTESPNQSLDNSRSGMRHIAAGVPLTDWWASAVSLRPYSLMGYNIQTERRLGADTSVGIVDRFSGNGGLSQVSWGNAFEIAENFSLGINASYIFGSLRESQAVDFQPLAFLDTRSETESLIAGLRLDYGLQYHYQWSESGHFAGLGITFSGLEQLDTEYSQFNYTSAGTNARDTLSGSGSINSSVQLPATLGIGFSFGQRNENAVQAAWGLSFDYEETRASQFIDARGRRPLQDYYRLQAGGFLTPRYAFNPLERSSNYLSSIEYRLGGFYEELPFALAGQRIQHYGITLGFGLPVRQRGLAPGEYKISTIHLAVIAGRRGTLAQNLIREDYLGLYLSVNFNDKWFIDYKYR